MYKRARQIKIGFSFGFWFWFNFLNMEIRQFAVPMLSEGSTFAFYKPDFVKYDLDAQRLKRAGIWMEFSNSYNSNESIGRKYH